MGASSSAAAGAAAAASGASTSTHHQHHAAGGRANTTTRFVHGTDQANRITVDIRGTLDSDWNVHVKRQDEGVYSKAENAVRNVSTTVRLLGCMGSLHGDVWAA